MRPGAPCCWNASWRALGGACFATVQSGVPMRSCAPGVHWQEGQGWGIDLWALLLHIWKQGAVSYTHGNALRESWMLSPRSSPSQWGWGLAGTPQSPISQAALWGRGDAHALVAVMFWRPAESSLSRSLGEFVSRTSSAPGFWPAPPGEL